MELLADRATLTEQIIARLAVRGILCGGTDAESVRRAIVDTGMQCVYFGRTEQIRCATYADAFEAAFGEPLLPRRKRALRRAT